MIKAPSSTSTPTPTPTSDPCPVSQWQGKRLVSCFLIVCLAGSLSFLSLSVSFCCIFQKSLTHTAEWGKGGGKSLGRTITSTRSPFSILSSTVLHLLLLPLLTGAVCCFLLPSLSVTAAVSLAHNCLLTFPWHCCLCNILICPFSSWCVPDIIGDLKTTLLAPKGML